jgi:hypothetical protein
MGSDREEGIEETAIRTLTKQEIDRRIEGLIREVALLRDDADEKGSTQPRWIEPAELVRRLRRFVVYN